MRPQQFAEEDRLDILATTLKIISASMRPQQFAEEDGNLVIGIVEELTSFNEASAVR